jgi:CNT family concentrative nucleoside transporter
VQPYYVRESNLFEAIITGANAGVRVIVGIAALLLAVLGLIALLDMLVAAAGDKLNVLMQTNLDWTLKGLLGYLFYPLTLIMGVPLQDAATVARIVGERTVATEVAGYQDLALAISKGTLTDPRSIVITTYALCGFAHFASMAIFVGGTAALAPERTGALSQIAVRALVAATLACLMTGCIAGVFCTGGSILTAR